MFYFHSNKLYKVGFSIKSKLIAVSILLIVLSISCVSAADAQNDENSTISIDSGSTINLEDTTNNNEILSDEKTGNFTSLASEIESAGGTLELTKNYTYDSTTDSDYASGIIINKEITIDGKGNTISGNNLARILYVNASNVVLKNIVFANGYINATDGKGGAIIWNGDSGNVINCTFASNTVENVQGGAIYWNGTDGSISDSEFSDNYAKTGGAIYWNGKTDSIDNSTFTSNTAMAAGGAIYWIGSGSSVKNSKFENNKATSTAGSIFYENTACNLVNTTFDKGNALMSGAITIQQASGTINNCTFTNCGLKNEYYNESTMGGAIYHLGNFFQSITITNSTFENNSAKKGSSVCSLLTNFNIYNSTFSDVENSLTVSCGYKLTLSNNTLYNNNYMKGSAIASSTKIILSNITGYINKDTNLTGVIVDDNENPIVIRKISILVGEESLECSFNNGIFYATYCPTTDDLGNTTLSATVGTSLSNPTIVNGTLTVLKSTPVIEINVNNTIYPNDIQIVVKSDVDGTYTYTVGSNSANITVENGTATFTLSKLAIGTYTVNIVSEESENYTATTAQASFKIIQPIQENANVNMYYLDGSTYKVRIYGADGNVAGAGVSVTFTINKKTYTVKTDSTGYATLKLNINTLVPKSYAITATYNGYSVKNTIKVKQIIKAKKTTKVKKTSKKLKIKITLKGKTVYKKKTLKVKFKGKTYKIKTNKKGIAYFKLTKKVIKKLKVGKTYKYTITYSKNTLKRYIKVKK